MLTAILTVCCASVLTVCEKAMQHQDILIE